MDLATKWEMAGEQLARFMANAMTLQSSSASKVGSFVGCTARFDGTDYKLESFISSVTLYKDMEGINDKTALHELSLLLEGEAATWWAGVKMDVHIWSEALRLLKRKFLGRKEPYEIYHEIFSVQQDEYIPIEAFIERKRALFDELPRSHSEEVQLDMIYSLLKLKIQLKVPRKSIATFDQLICEVHRLEHVKHKRKVRRLQRLKFFNSSNPVSKSTNMCLHCRECEEWGRTPGEVECPECKYERRIRTESRRETLSSSNTARSPLSASKPRPI